MQILIEEGKNYALNIFLLLWKKYFNYNFILKISMFTLCVVFFLPAPTVSAPELLQLPTATEVIIPSTQVKISHVDTTKYIHIRQQNGASTRVFRETSVWPKPMSTTSVILLIQYPYLICVSFSSVLLKNHSKGRSLLSISVLVLTQSASMCSPWCSECLIIQPSCDLWQKTIFYDDV